MHKSDLRLLYKLRRAALTADAIEAQSLVIANQLLDLPIWEHTYFHVFLPIVKQRDVNTEYILHVLAGKDKEVVVSKSDFATRQLTHFLLTDSTKISTNAKGFCINKVVITWIRFIKAWEFFRILSKIKVSGVNNSPNHCIAMT